MWSSPSLVHFVVPWTKVPMLLSKLVTKADRALRPQDLKDTDFLGSTAAAWSGLGSSSSWSLLSVVVSVIITGAPVGLSSGEESCRWRLLFGFAWLFISGCWFTWTRLDNEKTNSTLVRLSSKKKTCTLSVTLNRLSSKQLSCVDNGALRLQLDGTTCLACCSDRTSCYILKHDEIR